MFKRLSDWLLGIPAEEDKLIEKYAGQDPNLGCSYPGKCTHGAMPPDFDVSQPPPTMPSLSSSFFVDPTVLTQHFAAATRAAVADLHAQGIPAHGEIDGVWQEILPRPTWDEIWMRMAHLISQRSIDPRTKVGAVIVTADNTRVLGIGYNGDYRGGPNTVESLEPGKSGTIHAELNALIKCDYLPEIQRRMYVTNLPCPDCAKLILNGRIQEVIYDADYRITAGLELLRANGVTVRQFTPRPT